MSCVKNIFLIIFLNILGFAQINAQHSELDTVYFVKKTPFLQKILSYQDLDANINLSPDNNLIPLQGTVYGPNGQEIIKNNNSLYVNIQQTGFVYQLFSQNDSLLEFRRIDRTININYNIGCYNFLHEDQLYSYGGYGFWKTNGHIRQFNVIDKQWDIVPMNYEIFSNGYRWYSSEAEKLFVPFQLILNTGLKFIPENELESQWISYYLDLKQKAWFKLGKLDPSVRKIFGQEKNPTAFLSVKNGFLHIINDEIFYFSLSEGTHIGLLLALFGTFCASSGNIVHQRNINNKFPLIETIAFAMLYGSLMTLLIIKLSNIELLFEFTFSYVASLAYLSIFGSIFAFIFYLKLLEKIGPGRAGYVGVVMPVIALIISTIFESLDWQLDLIIGLPILLIGAYLVVNQKIKTTK